MRKEDVHEVALFYEEVCKARKLVRATIRGECSTIANRVMMALIAKVNYHDPDWDKTYSFRLTDLEERSGIVMHEKEVREICQAMVSTAAGFVEGKRMVWRTFFREIAYENGTIHCIFNDLIKPILAHLNDYVRFNYLDYLKLSTAYAQQLWELLTMFRKSRNEKPKIKLTELQDKLGVPVKLRGKFQKTRYILDRAKKEIEKKTDLKFWWEPDRKFKPKSINFYFGDERQEKQKQAEKAKGLKQSEKYRKAQDEWAKCCKEHQDSCEHYAKSKKTKCALCRKNKVFDKKDDTPAPLFENDNNNNLANQHNDYFDIRKKLKEQYPDRSDNEITSLANNEYAKSLAKKIPGI